MRIGLRVPPCRPLDEMVDVATRSEEAGFDYLWVPDSQLLWRDVWATTGAMAVVTDRITGRSTATAPGRPSSKLAVLSATTQVRPSTENS